MLQQAGALCWQTYMLWHQSVAGSLGAEWHASQLCTAARRDLPERCCEPATSHLCAQAMRILSALPEGSSYGLQQTSLVIPPALHRDSSAAAVAMAGLAEYVQPLQCNHRFK